MRHTFVSLLSSNGTALEDIANLVGHKGTAMTETVYRKVIVPNCGAVLRSWTGYLPDGSRSHQEVSLIAGSVALVTGANRGLGRYFAEQLLQRGVHNAGRRAERTPRPGCRAGGLISWSWRYLRAARPT